MSLSVCKFQAIMSLDREERRTRRGTSMKQPVSDESFVSSESRKGQNRETSRKVHLRQLFNVYVSFGDNTMAPCGEFRRRSSARARARVGGRRKLSVNSFYFGICFLLLALKMIADIWRAVSFFCGDTVETVKVYSARHGGSKDDVGREVRSFIERSLSTRLISEGRCLASRPSSPPLPFFFLSSGC